MKNRAEIQDRVQAILPWEYNRDTMCLVFDDKSYEVPLTDMTDSAQVLDWVIQVSKKTWADDAVIAGLVVGIDRFLSPQATLCSGGANKQISETKIRAMLSNSKTGEN